MATNGFSVNYSYLINFTIVIYSYVKSVSHQLYIRHPTIDRYRTSTAQDEIVTKIVTKIERANFE